MCYNYIVKEPRQSVLAVYCQGAVSSMLTTTDAALEEIRHRSQIFASNIMKNAHPIEIAIVVVIGFCEALWWFFRTVMVPTIVIVAVLVGYSPTRGETPSAPPQTAHTAPMIHPLSTVGNDLKQLTNRHLMALVGTKKKLTKAQLIGALVAS